MTTDQLTESAPGPARAPGVEGGADPESDGTGLPAGRVKRRVSRRMILLAGLVGLILVGGILWLTSWQSPVPVRDVVVDGAAKGSVREIKAAADIRKGTALRDVDVSGAVERVVALPGIVGAELVINRPWTVAIVVDERHPVAQVQTAGGYLILDNRGEVIRESDQKLKRIPVVTVPQAEAEPATDGAATDSTGTDGDPPAAGGQDEATVSADVGPDSWATGIQVLNKLREPFVGRVATVSTDPNGRTQLTLRRGTVVLLGDAEAIERKGEVAEALLKLKPEIINVTVPSRPAVTGGIPAETPQAAAPTAGH